jgi:hypothetical protein
LAYGIPKIALIFQISVRLRACRQERNASTCLVLGYKFRYRESILLIFRKRKLQLLNPYRSMGGEKLQLPLTENYRSLTRRSKGSVGVKANPFPLGYLA